MPKFRDGAPQVRFRKKDGSRFTKTYHSRTAAARSIRGWRKAGGTVIGTGQFRRGGGGSRHLFH